MIVWGRNLPLPCLSLAACLAVGLGCSEDTSIRQYRVAKKDSQRSAAAPAIAAAAAPAKEQLMLAAIVPNQDFAWFFKLTGDPDVVLKNDPDFRNIVKSVAFDGTGQPTWKLSDGWQQQITPEEITYGKLTNKEAGLTATVTRLPFTSNATEESWRGYIVSNINRWRNQLSLQQQEWEQMSSELEEFPELSQGPAKAYFVSISGKGSGGMSAPFMNRGPRGPMPSPTAAENAVGESDAVSGAALPPASEPKKPITYRVPEGWSETAASGMRMAAFAIVDGQSTGEVTVIAAGGGIEANIGIWLGQVGAEASAETTQRILAAAEELTVDGVTAKFYTIEGSAEPAGEAEADVTPQEQAAESAEGAPAIEADKVAAAAPTASSAAQAILLVDIPWREGQSLFVKFKGAQTLAQAQRQAFVEFAKSIEWN